MWFGTDMGLSRYDGYRFSNFQLSDIPPAVRKIEETSDSLLWVLDSNGDIECFDPQQEKIIPTTINSVSGNTASFTGLVSIGNKCLYVTGKQGLELLQINKSRQNGTMVIDLQSEGETSLPQGNEWSILCKDDKKKIFALSEKNKQLYCYNPEDGISQLFDISDIYHKYKISVITGMYVENNCVWLFNRWQGIICYHLKEKTHREIDLPMAYADVKEVGAIGKNDYCLVTWNGLFKINFKETPIEGEYEITRLSDIPDNKIENKSTSIYFDPKECMLWVGTFGGGVLKILPDNVFTRWINLPGNIEANKIIEDNYGSVWLSTVGHGLMKSKDNSISEDMTFTPWNPSVFASGKYSLSKDRKGMLWAGDEFGNIFRISPLTNEYLQYQITLENNEPFAARIQDFFLDADDNLWILTLKGVILFNQQTKKFSLVKNPELDGKRTSFILEDADGDIWLGTQDGLVRITKNNGILQCFTGYEKEAGLKPSLVYSIFITRKNQIIAAYADKLILINEKNKNLPEKSFSLGNGLPNGQIYCLTEDLKGNLWLGSNSGIMIMKVGTNLIYNYLSNGNNTAVYCLSDGRLMWSTSNGFFYCDPDKIDNDQNNQKLVLSKLVVDNQTIQTGKSYNGQILLPQSISSLDRLTFDHSNKNFTLYFSDLQYKNISPKILYRILPDNEKWNVLNIREGLTFTKLRAGTHTLQVQSLSYDDRKGDPLIITIQILPHWSMTWWAWMLYLCALIFIGYLIYRILKYRVSVVQQRQLKEEKLKNELYRIELKRKQDKETITIKNKLQELIINELRSPLFMIINPLKEMLESNELPQRLKYHAEIAYHNSVDLKDICIQLMDSHRFETEQLCLQVAKWNLPDIIEEVIRKQQEFINIYQIEFIYTKSDSDHFGLWIDKDMIAFSIRSLLSNAYRHVLFAGKVTLHISQETIDKEAYCVLSFTDYGKKKVEENMEELLSQISSTKENLDFSQLEFGLELLKKIISLHHGTLVFDSEEECTCVKIYLKYGVEHLTHDPNVTFIQSTAENKLEDTFSLPEISIWNPEEELPEITPGNGKKKLMVIDDNRMLRLSLKVIFTPEYTVLEAANGQEGIDLSIKEQPDLILCDVMMPLKNGLECCRELKEDIRTCHIPIIFLTAKNMDEDMINAMDIGAEDYLTKPVQVNILKAKVSNVIKNRENLKQIYLKQLIYPTENNENDNNESTPIIEDSFVKEVIELIEKHLHEVDFGVGSLTCLLNISQPTLYRRVKQSTEFNITELIRGVRLRRAAQLLDSGKHSVQEVIEMVGYNDSASFRKHFMKLYGMIPSIYIKRNRINEDKK